jgi:hypothetical protein
MARPRPYAPTPQHQSARGKCQSFSEDLEPYLPVLRTERHAEPDLWCPLRDCEGHDPIDAERLNISASTARPPKSAIFTRSGAKNAPTT